MRAISALAIGLALLASPAPGAASGRGLSFGPPASWVEGLRPDLAASPDASEVSGGVHYLLLDHQTRVGAGPDERFRHIVTRIVNEAGLEASSQLSLSYDPSYQSLRLHNVGVRRNGTLSNRLDPDRVELVQREPELESQIFDGRLSAILFIEDLRVGDVLEYSYSLRGANPVFDGRFSDSFDVEWTVPLRHQRVRLVWPEERSLRVMNHGTSIAPRIERKGRWREYVWDLEDSAPVEGAGAVPAWYPQWGWVQVSEYATWSEVADWARPLFGVPAALPAELAAEVAIWQRLPDDAERALAALRFVQDEVRYVGIELGTGSHRPSPPGVVFSRRFGDCKDKALLLVTLLGELGIRAEPALVHTGLGAALDDWLPTPHAFNHVVVRIVIDGRAVWVDPTWSVQGGSLEGTYFPSLERALVVAESTDGLTEIPRVTLDRPTTVVREEYRVVDESTPVAYTVETRYEGGDADRIRYRLRRESHQQVESRYLDYYERTWPDIRKAGDLEVEDDRAANVVVVREHYAIPGFWSAGSTPGSLESELWASTLGSELGRPDIADYAPLAVDHPVFLRHTTQVHLPGDWGLEPAEAEVRSPAALFSYRARPGAGSIDLEYEYRTLAPVVPADAVEGHVARLDEMWNHLSFELKRPAGGRLTGTNWVAVLAFLLGAALAGTGSVAFARLIPERRPRSRRRRLSAAFLGVLLLGGVVGHAEGLMRAWRLASPASWGQRTLPDGPLYHPLWEPFLLAHLVMGVMFLTTAVLLLALFVRGNERGRAAFVLWAFAQTGLLFAAAATLAALPGAVGSGLAEATRAALVSLVPLVAGSAAALVSSRSALSGEASRSRR